MATKNSTRFLFSKTRIESLPELEPGTRVIYRDTRTPHFCIRHTPTVKSFFWEKTVRGRKTRVTIGPYPELNPENARKRAEAISADYVNGIDVAAAKKGDRDELTLGALWQDFKQNRQRRVIGKEPVTLNYQWTRFFEDWASFRLSEISFERARNMILRLRKKAPFHANRIQRHGRAMFNHAKKELRWRGDNPFDFAFVSEKGRARKERLKTGDMPQFMKGLDACSEAMRLVFISALYTGRRLGEVCAMRWVDLDLETGMWNIPQTKSGESQQAVLPTLLIDELVKRRRKINSPWVYPSSSKSGHVEEIKKAWAQVRKVSGLGNLQARDLRRTLASWAQDTNVPIAVVQAQLGHADIATTAKHYTAIDQTVQRRALDATVQSMVAAGAAK